MYFKVLLFMNKNNSPLDTLQDIKRMMEQSSRFISLSGWSGISAGICALFGGYFAHRYLLVTGFNDRDSYGIFGKGERFSFLGLVQSELFIIALSTLIAAILLAFFFTYRYSKRKSVSLWNASSKRMLESMLVPLVAGGLFSLFIAYEGLYGLVAPALLVFYGLSIVNASKYTLKETKWLGYCQIALGLMNLLFIGYGLYFWMLGFGVLHILYGIIMWNKYERLNLEA